jgi:hypothetical protein
VTKILWWNVQRLGAATAEARKNGLSAMIGKVQSDMVLLCELVQTSTDPPALNLTYRKIATRQLCYGAIGADSKTPAVSKFKPTWTVEYAAAGFKGGKDFGKLCSRAPGYVQLPDGVHLYFIHAPASSGGGARAVAFIACHLHAHHGDDPWLLVGDMNVEPTVLAAKHTGINLGDLIKPPNRATHGAKRLDYALSNMVNVTVVVEDGAMMSDHEPIVVEYR